MKRNRNPNPNLILTLALMLALTLTLTLILTLKPTLGDSGYRRGWWDNVSFVQPDGKTTVH